MAVLIGFCHSSLQAQVNSDPVVISQGGNPTGILIVYLVGADGTPVTAPGVVTVLRAGEASGPHEMTGSNNVVRFNQLANATYTIIVSVAGYKDQRSEADITPGASMSEVTVSMERANEGAPQQAAAKGMMLVPKAKKEAQKGIDAMRAGQYDEAQRHLQAALQLAPGNPDLNDRMGELFIVTKDYEKAQTYLRQALSIEPDNAGALTDIGWLRVQQGNNPDAQTSLQRAVTIDPQRWFAHWLLGVCYLREGQFDGAREEALTAMKVGKGAAYDAEYLLGESLAALGQNDDAIKALQQLLKDSPENSNAPAARALIARLQAGETQTAPSAPTAPSIANPVGDPVPATAAN
jgi:Flp pilus assembly protein TadD